MIQDDLRKYGSFFNVAMSSFTAIVPGSTWGQAAPFDVFFNGIYRSIYIDQMSLSYNVVDANGDWLSSASQLRAVVTGTNFLSIVNVLNCNVMQQCVGFLTELRASHIGNCVMPIGMVIDNVNSANAKFDVNAFYAAPVADANVLTVTYTLAINGLYLP